MSSQRWDPMNPNRKARQGRILAPSRPARFQSKMWVLPVLSFPSPPALFPNGTISHEQHTPGPAVAGQGKKSSALVVVFVVLLFRHPGAAGLGVTLPAFGPPLSVIVPLDWRLAFSFPSLVPLFSLLYA